MNRSRLLMIGGLALAVGLLVSYTVYNQLRAHGASNPQIKPLKARYLNAVITNLLFAQPRAAVLAAQRQLPRLDNDQPNLRKPRLRS